MLKPWPIFRLVVCVALAGCGSGAAPGTSPSSTVFTVPTKLPPRTEATVSTPSHHATTPAPTPAPTPAAPTPFSDADRASFAALAAQLPGDEGIAVAGVGRVPRVWALGSVSSGTAWSTSKVPVAMAVFHAGLDAQQGPDLDLAIEQSDNAAAERLFAALGSPTDAARAADQELRAAGDSRTVIESRRLLAGYTPFGQTDWSLNAQVRFMAGMRCASEGPHVMDLMAHIVPSERWGLGTLSNPEFKGGWGPGSRPGSPGPWMERQMGLVSVHNTRIAVAIASVGTDHAQGVQALDKLAQWIATHMNTAALSRSGC